MTLPIVAGSISTVIFVVSYLPMLVKAARTKDLSSYSLSSMLLANAGNAIHSLYVFHLPAGPLWALHTFYLVTTGLMLAWYVRYARRKAAPVVEADTPVEAPHVEEPQGDESSRLLSPCASLSS